MKIGNITEIDKYRVGIESDNGLFKYAYDPLNRLVGVTNNQDTRQYNYDSIGNRVASINNGMETKHQFNARNQLIKTTEGDILTDYSYDKRGNLISEVINGQPKASYTFDARNQLVAVSNQLGSASYSYDGFRNRVRKLESFRQEAVSTTPDPAKEVRYVLDMTLPYDNLLATHGAESQSFTWGNSLLSGTGAGTFYYLQDHLGSPTRLLDLEGNQDALAYDEFGVMNAGSGQIFNNPFGFTGYQVDNVSGLQYAQARYYNQNIGRFSAEDPVKDQFNWYGYCSGNPLALTDPSGLALENGGFDAGAYHQNRQNNSQSINTPSPEVGLWLIHGTTFDVSYGPGQWPDDFRKGISGAFNLYPHHEPFVPNWGGGIRPEDRATGAQIVFDEVSDWHGANPDTPIILAGYSHGGNVAKLVINGLYISGVPVNDIVKLITIGTPAMDGYDLLSPVSQHINIYSNRDIIQFAGRVLENLFSDDSWFNGLTRHFDGAENRSVINLPLFGVHGEMHSNVEVWQNIIIPLLILELDNDY